MHQRPHEQLVAWQEAYKLCRSIYALTKKFPSDERYGLTQQMRRSSYSVPTNIAEGNRKSSHKEKRHFFEIALCSLEELHCEARLSHDLGYIKKEEFIQIDDHINRVSFLLSKLRAAFK
jgi:four helix bundle protein